jgi:diguanylate cyclase (GGDEF)-like protein
MTDRTESNALPVFTPPPARSARLRRGGLSVTQRARTRIPDTQDHPVLLRTDKANAGQVLSVGETETTLGRHPDNVACVDDEGISRFHAKLFRLGPHCYIEDLGSSNGTHVNGELVVRRELENGDIVQLGSTACFRFSIVSATEELALRKLYEASVRDPLTGVFNRHHLTAQTEAEIAFAKRHGAPLALLVCDIDHFKQVNDRYGHLAGDEVLCQVASVLGRGLRACDLLARFGGEEFVVVLRGTELEPAAIVAERLRNAIATTSTHFLDQNIGVTLSIGLAALVECQDVSLPGLLHLADTRLYRAKTEGRNRVVAR